MVSPSRMGRREFLAAGALLLARTGENEAAEVLQTKGAGDVATPRFFRHDIGTAPGRMHEPGTDPDGNLWTSPLDGTLWRYETGTGKVEVLSLEKLTGRPWQGLHLWPVAHGGDVYLCTPSLPELWVWRRDRKEVRSYPFPHKAPSVYGGFVVPAWDHVWFYDTRHAAVLKWDPKRRLGTLFLCPYKLSGTLYMTFAEPGRREIWGSTYTGNDLVRFDVPSEKWTGHYRCPLAGATPTPGARVFDGTLWVSDHLNGRIIPFDVAKEKWGDPVAVPGFRDWFGYLSGGWHFRGMLYLCHSTWSGGDRSIDGEPHHFIGSWTIFDPKTRKFSRLDIPTRKGEVLRYLQSDYCGVLDNEMYILAVNARPPQNVLVLRTKPLP
jgi:streptogramin lyase